MVVWAAFPLVETKDDWTVAEMAGSLALKSAEMMVYLTAEMSVDHLPPQYHSVLQKAHRASK